MLLCIILGIYNLLTNVRKHANYTKVAGAAAAIWVIVDGGN